jgi:hypothetical protein
MRPNSNSLSSALRGDTRCDEDTMPGARRAALGLAAGMLVFPESLKKR